jgi:hypothetical protein
VHTGNGTNYRSKLRAQWCRERQIRHLADPPRSAVAPTGRQSASSR